MPGEKRSKAQKIKDREQIAALKLRGRTLQQIAEAVGISVMTVRRELKALMGEWQVSAAEDIAAVKARELQKLDALEEEAWREWERSKEDWVKKSVKKGGATAAGTKAAPETKVETGGQTGDPRYLQALLGIQDRRARLLGIDAPSKITATNPDGTEERPLGAYVFPVPPGTDLDSWREMAAQAAAKASGA